MAIQAGAKSISRTETVVLVLPIIDPVSGLQEVKIEFKNTDGQVWPNFTGTMLSKTPEQLSSFATSQNRPLLRCDLTHQMENVTCIFSPGVSEEGEGETAGVNSFNEAFTMTHAIG